MKRLNSFLRTAVSLSVLVMGIYNAKSANVTLAWDPNPEGDLGGYYIYFGTNTLDRVDVKTGTSITLSNLVAGVRYSIYATAYNQAGVESAPSETIFYTPIAEIVNPVLAMQAVNGQVTLSGTAIPSQPVVIQAATSLNAPEWITVQTITPGTDGRVSIQLMEHLLNPRRFYRLAVLP
jgi:hypothetical protein